MTAELLTIGMFSDKIGDAFVVEVAGIPPLELKLSESRALQNFAAAARAPFSLHFTSQGDFMLPQGTYALRHATLGLQSIFLVPIARQGNVATYEAVFN
jgi:hypothetical protein